MKKIDITKWKKVKDNIDNINLDLFTTEDDFVLNKFMVCEMVSEETTYISQHL